MVQELVTQGGIETFPQFAVQTVFLDFDGELTSYDGEILTVDEVEVEDSGLTRGRIETIVARLNAEFASQYVRFTADPAEALAAGEYSTIYVGRTSAFTAYGSFAGLAETVDHGNKNKTDKAFVMLDATSSDEAIIDTISHEAGHLIGALDHGGPGLAAYAAKTTIPAGVTSTNLTIASDNSLRVSGIANSTTINSVGRMYVYSDGSANETTVNSGGTLYVSSGGTATNIVENGGYVWAEGATVTFTPNTFSNLILSRSATVHSGTTADATTVNSDGYMNVYSGGTANETTVNLLGRLSIHSGGTANSTTINSVGYIRVYSDGSANETTVNSDGYMYVYSGGTANETTVNSGGRLYVSSGGTAAGIVAENGARLRITVAPDTYIQGTRGGTTFEMTDAHITGYAVNSGGYLHVSSGGTANSTTVNEYGDLTVSSGGTANSTTVNSGGGMDVSSGGTANSTTVNSGGYLHVSSGGTATNIVENGGYVGVAEDATVTFTPNTLSNLVLSWTATVHSGTTADSTTVNIYGGLYVFSGGTAKNTTVDDGGYMDVFSGGTANYTTVNAGGGMYDVGGMYVSSGGTANNTTVNSSGGMFVSSGGTANDTTVNSGGSITVSSGGTANSTTVNSDGVLYVFSGGTANSTTVNLLGQLSIHSGGTATNIVENGGYVGVAEDATVTFTPNTFSNLVLSWAATVHSGTTADSTTVDPRGYMYVYSGGTAKNTTVDDGGYMDVFSGGTANSTTVNSGGTLFVSSGGTANSTTINSVGYMCVYSDGSANETTVNSYGRLRICSGGTANETTVNSGGTLFVSSGGTANETTVNSGGIMYVSSGGTATGIIAEDKSVFYVEVASGTWFQGTSGGKAFEMKDATINGFTVNSLGSMGIASGGTADEITVNPGGRLTVSSGGTANETTVNSGGALYVSSGGTMNHATLNSGGYISAFGGTINAIGVNAGGRMVIWGVVTATNIVENGGSVSVVEGANVTFMPNTFSGLTLINAATLHSGTTAVSTTVSGGDLYVFSGGTANSTSAYGRLYVSAGGMANETTVSRGSLVVFNDGTANKTTVDGSGSMTVSNGGTANSTAVNSGGTLFVSSGGTANETTVNSDGRLRICSGGTANETTVGGSGSMTVSNGGTANSTAVNSDGYMYVYSGGTANETTVNSGGLLRISSGGTANGTTANSYGRMIISSGGVLKGSLNIETGAVISAFTGAIIDFTVAEISPENEALINDLSLIAGTPDFTITVSATQAEGRYTLAKGAAGFAGTLALGTGEENYGSITVNGESLTHGAYTYTLATQDDSLLLTVDDGAVPEVLSVTPDTAAATNQNVTVSATFRDGSVQKQYSFDNDIWNDYTKPVVMENNGTVYFRGTDAAGNVSEVVGYEVTNIDKVAPAKPVAAASTTVPTNRDVTVTATFSEDSAQKQYSSDGATWETYTSGVVMTANGTVYFRGTDAAGNVSEVASYEVTNIDKVAPEKPTAGADITTPTNGNVTVTATFSDDSAQKQYSSDGGATWETYIQSIVMTANGTVSFRGIDAAGNVSEVTRYTANNIDKVAPAAPTASADITSPTNQNVTVSAIFSEDSEQKQYSFDGENFSAYGKGVVMEENGKVYFRGIDAAGNISDVTSYAVTNIDRAVPVLTVSGNADAPTNQSLTLIASSNKNVTIEYSFDNANWTQGDRVTVEENRAVRFRAVDAAGNITETSVVVDKIDKVKPETPVVISNGVKQVGAVVVPVTFSDDSVQRQYSTDGETWNDYTSVFSAGSGEIIYFRGRDEAGNFSDIASYVKPAPLSILDVSANVTEENVFVNSGGSMVILSGGSANLATVNSGGRLRVYGTANSTAVNSGLMTVFSGGTAVNTIISGGPVYINSGGTAVSTIISHGPLYIYGGGTAVSTIISGGPMHITSGGTANYTALSSGALAVSNGTVNYTTVANLWSIMYLSGGTANVTTVNSGGHAYISSGGTANSTSVNSGWMIIFSGGTGNSATVNSGGTMYVSGGGKVTGQMSFADGAVVSAFSGAVVDFTVAGHTVDGGYLINNLAMITGTPTFTITVSENQSVGTYKLAQGASAFSGTLSIGTETANYGTITVNGESLVVNDTAYSLSRADGNLTLTVSEFDNVPPAKPAAVPSTTATTNQNVTVSATFSSDSAQKQYSLDGDSWNTYTGGIVMSGNGTVYFRGIDEAGNISEVASYAVTNIDKVPPTAPTVEADVTAPTCGDVTVFATFSEDSAQRQYSLDNVSWTDYTRPVVMENNGTVCFRAIDAVGNISDVVSYAVTNIDRVPPTAPTAGADVTGPTNQNVTVTASFSEDSIVREYSRDGENFFAYDNGVVMEDNGTVFFRGIDAAGNVSDVTSYAVTNIDRIPPTQPIAMADITAVTDGEVTVTAVFSGDSAVREYSLDGETWQDYDARTGVVMEENGTVYFRGIDAAGNISSPAYCTVTNIDKTAPVITLSGDNVTPAQQATLTGSVDDGSSLYYRISGTEAWTAYTGPIEVTANAVYEFKATDAAGNTGTASITFANILSTVPENLSGSAEGLSWDSTGATRYVVEFSTDDFAHALRTETTAAALDSLNLPQGNYQWRVRTSGNGAWATGEQIAVEAQETAPRVLQSDADGDLDLFFARSSGRWSAGFDAQHAGVLDGWEGTGELVRLEGRNRLCDIFRGSNDADILVMTDDACGDALFLDDIYSEFPAQQRARIAQIDEIRAGAGDDIVDLTSQRFEYANSGMTVRGGLGNDTVWANSGNNVLFGDAGNDRLVGAAGNDTIVGGAGNDSMHGGGGKDTFTFGANWGADTVEQLAGGEVTLWFASDVGTWDEGSLTYSDGANSVTVSGVTADRVTLKFGAEAGYDALASLGAFSGTTSEKIFEDTAKGLLA